MIENKDGPIRETSKLSQWLVKYSPFGLMSGGVLVFVLLLWDLYQKFTIINAIPLAYLPIILIYIGIGSALFISGVYGFIQGNVKFEFKEDGILVTYPLKKQELVAWDEFQQICICYTGYNNNANEAARAISVICFAKKERERIVTVGGLRIIPFVIKKLCRSNIRRKN